jgi:hypothetical protein
MRGYVDVSASVAHEIRLAGARNLARDPVLFLASYKPPKAEKCNPCIDLFCSQAVLPETFLIWANA